MHELAFFFFYSSQQYDLEPFDSRIVPFMHNYAVYCGFFADLLEATAAVDIWTSVFTEPSTFQPGPNLDLNARFLDACLRQDLVSVRNLLIPGLTIGRDVDRQCLGLVDVNVIDKYGRGALLISVVSLIDIFSQSHSSTEIDLIDT